MVLLIFYRLVYIVYTIHYGWVCNHLTSYECINVMYILKHLYPGMMLKRLGFRRSSFNNMELLSLPNAIIACFRCQNKPMSIFEIRSNFRNRGEGGGRGERREWGEEVEIRL